MEGHESLNLTEAMQKMKCRSPEAIRLLICADTSWASGLRDNKEHGATGIETKKWISELMKKDLEKNVFDT